MSCITVTEDEWRWFSSRFDGNSVDNTILQSAQYKRHLALCVCEISSN